jgi:hypothetical protein
VWNWCGAVLYWVYFTELRQAPAVWRQVVLWLAGLGIVTELTGSVVGLVRWRPRGRARPGRRTPYQGLLRWHHLLGLAAAGPVCTWVISGWLSLEPGRWVAERDVDRVTYERYAALERMRSPFTVTPAEAWDAAAMDPPAKEVRLEWWEGQPRYVFAASSDHLQRISGHERPLAVAVGGVEALTQAARRLLPEARLTRSTVLDAYDFYWYAHHEPRPLPVLRVTFDDPRATWFHIDLATGTVLERLDTSGRWYRILFRAAHRLDFPVLLAHRPAWDLVVLPLCGLGLTLSVTALGLTWRRLRTVWRQAG